MNRVNCGVRVRDRFADDDPGVEIEVAEVFAGGALLGCYRVSVADRAAGAFEYREYARADLLARERRDPAPLLDPGDLVSMVPAGCC